MLIFIIIWMLHLLMNRDYWSYLSMQSCVNLIEFIKIFYLVVDVGRTMQFEFKLYHTLQCHVWDHILK